MVLTEEQKNEIINRYKLKWTVKRIAEEMNLTSKTVHLWIKRYKQNQSLDRKQGSGIKITDLNKPH